MIMTTKIDEAMIRQLASQHAPGLENAVVALSLLESSKGANEAAYRPNAVGAIGPMQILSKSLGGKYGNFEAYSLPDMKDPMNPVHSTVAGIRMFNDLVKKHSPTHGLDGAVNAYFTGTPTPKATRTDGISTAAQYLTRFKDALGSTPPRLPSLATPGFNPSPGPLQPMGEGAAPFTAPLPATAAGAPQTSALDVAALLRRAVTTSEALAGTNRASMGTFGVDDKVPNSAINAGGAGTAANIKELAAIVERNRARFQGPEFDAKNPLTRLADQVLGGARDKSAFRREQGSLAAMQAALAGQQKLAGNQQGLNAGASEDIASLVKVAMGADSREQGIAAQRDRALLQSEVSRERIAAQAEAARLRADTQKAIADQAAEIARQKVAANSVQPLDELLQKGASIVGMQIPAGMKAGDAVKIYGPETVQQLAALGGGGSLATNATDAVVALQNPALPANFRQLGAPLAAYVNAASQSPEFVDGVLKGANLLAMEPKQQAAVRSQLLNDFVTRKLAEASKGEGKGLRGRDGKLIPSPYDNYGASIGAAMGAKGLPPPTSNVQALDTLLSSKLTSAEIAEMYRGAVANNRFDLFGAPKQQAIFWQDSNVNGGKPLNLTLPQHVELLRAARTAAARARTETPGMFQRLSELFGRPPSNADNLVLGD